MPFVDIVTIFPIETVVRVRFHTQEHGHHILWRRLVFGLLDSQKNRYRKSLLKSLQNINRTEKFLSHITIGYRKQEDSATRPPLIIMVLLIVLMVVLQGANKRNFIQCCVAIVVHHFAYFRLFQRQQTSLQNNTHLVPQYPGL